MIDDHQHQRLYDEKGVWHSVGRGRSQREGEGEEEGHSNVMERDLHRDNHFIYYMPASAGHVHINIIVHVAIMEQICMGIYIYMLLGKLFKNICIMLHIYSS